jgi:outer membrane protein W
MLSMPLFGQPSEVGVFVNRASFHRTTFNDSIFGIPFSVTLKFDSKAGYGISYNRFVSPSLSAEFSAQVLRGDTTIVTVSPTDTLADPAGTLDLRQYDAALQWHFMPRASIDPYVGAGLAWFQGGKLTIPADNSSTNAEEKVKLDNKITWLATAGVAFRVTPSASVVVGAKYTRYETGIDADPDAVIQKLKLDPRTYTLGVRWRF